MRALRLSSLLLVLALAGCAATSNVRNPQQQAQAQQARSLFNQGQYSQAAQSYLQLAAQHPASSGHFRVLAAEAWRENGSLAQAAQALASVQRNRLQQADAQHYAVLEAEIALKHGDAARALTLTKGLVFVLPQTLQPRALELRAQALAATGKTWQAARERIQLDTELQGAARAHNREMTLKLLGALGITTLKQHAAQLAADDPAQPWITATLGQLGVGVASAALPLNQPVGTFMPGSNQVEGYVLPHQVALVLPLSGPLAAAGEAVRQGFFASYFQAEKRGDLPPVTVYDSTGTAAGSVAAYNKAVAAGATLVVGPLTHDGVSAILQQAPLQAALLALNHPDDNVVPPPNVTEFGLRPEVEAAQIARHMSTLGLTQAIILVSSEGFAQRAAKAFTTQFQGQGGQVLSTTTLNPAEVDYAQKIAALNAAGLTQGVGIFISMRPSQARLLLPQLRLATIKLPVFATSHVYAGRANAVADGDLNGVIFCDAPWLFNAQPGLPSRTALARLTPAARGTSARLFAFGMDAWSLVPYLKWLRTHPGSYLPGASGRLTEDAFGHVQRTMIWAQFKNGLAQPVAGNLQMGTPTLQPAPATTTTPTPTMGPTQTQPAAATSNASATTTPVSSGP